MGWSLGTVYEFLGTEATALGGVHADHVDPTLGIVTAVALIGLAVYARWPKAGGHDACAQPGGS